MKKLILLGAAALMLFACSKEDMAPASVLQESEGNKAVFHAATEGSDNPGTKVFADEDLKVMWNEDDRITIFNWTDINSQYMFLGEDGDTAGDFEEIPGEDEFDWGETDHIYAVYPYSPDNQIDDSNSQITVTLPAEQTFKEHSFGIGANTMVAVTDDNFLGFKNVCGYMKFRFYGDNIRVKTIKFEGNNGEKIAGKAYIDPVFGGNPSVSMDGTATGSITINCAEPVTLGPSREDFTEFIFVIPPTTFTKGFKITVTDVYGQTFVKSSTRSVTISRNKMEAMNQMKVNIDYTSMPFSVRMVNDGTINWYVGDHSRPKLNYSTDGGITWTKFTGSITLAAGEEIQFLTSEETSTQKTGMGQLRSSGTYDVYGNFASLYYREFNDKTTFPSTTTVTPKSFFRGSVAPVRNAEKLILPFTILPNYAYEAMFYLSEQLERAPELPATTLGDYCYLDMFHSCKKLTKAPSSLNATQVGQMSCHSMFYNCTSLTKAPDLPATILSRQSYDSMFYGCTSLTKAPELPATTLGPVCYQYMFQGCTALIEGPSILPATTLELTCYKDMFNGCTSLIKAPELPATTLANQCYQSMFYKCTSLKESPILPAKNLKYECYTGMFSHCSSLNKITCLAEDLYSTNTTNGWASEVASTGTFIKAKGMENWSTDNNGIPKGWTVIDYE